MENLIFPLELTASAIERLDDLLSPSEVLRVSLRGGGCAGMEYQFDIETEPASQDDHEKTFKGHVRVRIDPVSATYLHGSTLDFEVERFNSQFVMRNPKVTTTCGCGKSFTA